MKKKVVLFTLLMLALVLLTSIAIAQGGATSKSLSTNFTMVNLSPTDQAQVTVEYLKDDGSAWAVGSAYAGPFTLDANGGQIQLRQYFDNDMSSGKGSVTLNSTAPLGAIAQIQARGQTPSNGAYSGVSQGSEKIYLPLAAKKGASASGEVSSQIVIQNTGSGDVTASVKLVDLNGNTTYTKSGIVIASKNSYYYDLALESDSNLPANWFGSATVEVDTTASPGGTVTAVSNLFMGSDMLQTFNGFAQEEIGAKWANPSFFSRLSNGLSTVMTVQNVSGAEMAVGSITASCVETLSSTGSATLSLTNTVAVGDFASYNFNPVTDMSIPSGWIGACTITTPGNSVAFIQMRYVGAAYPLGAAFNALKSSGTSTTVVVPLVAKRLGNTFSTVVTVQNLSDTASAHVTFTYSPSSESSSPDVVTVGPYEIPAGASLQHNHRLEGNGGTGSNVHNLPDGFVGSLTVTSSDQPIDGYVQLTWYDPGSAGGGDSFMAHNVFVQ